MYKINPSDAMTEMYGINKGSAQVFDQSIAVHNLDRAAAVEERKAAAKVKAEQDRIDDISLQMSKMGGISYMPHDQPIIAQQTKGVQDYVRQNIDKLKGGDVNAMLEFQQKKGELSNTYAMSHDKRQKFEQAVQMKATNPEKFREDTDDNLADFMSSKYAGKFDFNPAEFMKPNIDAVEDMRTNVRPLIEDAADKGSYDYIDPNTGVKTSVKTDSLPDRTVYGKDGSIKNIGVDYFLHNRIAEDHNLYDNQLYKLQKADEATQEKYRDAETGGFDVNRYYVDKMIPYARIHRDEVKKDAPSGGNEWDSSHVINATYQPSKDGKVFTINANSQKPTTLELGGKKQTIMLGEVKQDKNGNIIGEATVQLTPEQKQENDAVRHEAYEKDFNEYKQKIASLTDVNEIAAIPKPIKEDAKYRNLKIPNPDTKKLGYTETSQILKNVYGIDNIYETFNNDKSPAEHVDMKTTDTRGQKDSSQEDWNSKWASLKKGESMKGLDGKTYTKK